jgi:hypothetical protein
MHGLHVRAIGQRAPVPGLPAAFRVENTILIQTYLTFPLSILTVSNDSGHATLVQLLIVIESFSELFHIP